jgi:hypothetical protein
MFAALHCETIGFARVRFSIKPTSTLAQRNIAFRTLARSLNRKKRGTLFRRTNHESFRFESNPGNLCPLAPAV